jgi:hypothetical protein
MNSNTLITVAAIAAAAFVMVSVMRSSSTPATPAPAPAVNGGLAPPATPAAPTQADIRAGIDLVKKVQGQLFQAPPPGKTLPASSSGSGLTNTLGNLKKAVTTGKSIYDTGKGIWENVKALW